ncbi:ATP-grasp ribosomal peptide maturase [Streptomyces sp. BPTC-684]|uniref:ATP-grasp ribosomal peptide maturase n=1 Tax=Streptomyces sp. BPTC-684 TaxID=3043734 RepID=UPI0024B0F459|nr:ATP-grasp ribosomal peptide maturase [Streptomyces sp. BPTC-684]WHM36331.1 ATP-grasp ribosomal peptide maturase [Streptomyces sp. BPTC-684]
MTSLGDVTADLVLAELHDRGVPVVRLDPGTDFPDNARLSARLNRAGLSGRIATPSRLLDLASVRSVYWRRPTPYGGTGAAETPEDQFTNAQARAGYSGILAALPGAHYVNHPWRNRDADHKPLQLAVAARLNLPVPETLITTVPDDARRFIAKHGPAIYKPVRTVHIVGEEGKGRTVWVRTVEPDEIDDSVSTCPHLFQSCIPKIADIRLAVVGNDMIATRIDGGHLDWREDQTHLAYTPITIPDSIRTAVRAYLKAFGLVFGAFDFTLAKTGTWWFLECNPNGQWAFVDNPTCQTITRALADTLQKGAPA